MTSCSLEYDVGYFRRIDLGPLRSEVNHTRGGHYPLRTYSRTARFVGAGGQEMFACKHRFVMNISRVPPLAVAADENRRHCTAVHSIRAVRAERGGGAAVSHWPKASAHFGWLRRTSSVMMQKSPAPKNGHTIGTDYRITRRNDGRDQKSR